MDEQDQSILSYERRGGPLRAGLLIVTSLALPIVFLLVPPLLYGLVWLNVLPFSFIVSTEFRWALRIIVLLPLMCAVLDIVLIFHLNDHDDRSREGRWLMAVAIWNISLGIGALLALRDDLL